MCLNLSGSGVGCKLIEVGGGGRNRPLFAGLSISTLILKMYKVVVAKSGKSCKCGKTCQKFLLFDMPLFAMPLFAILSIPTPDLKNGKGGRCQVAKSGLIPPEKTAFLSLLNLIFSIWGCGTSQNNLIMYK